LSWIKTYDLADLYGKKLRFTSETHFWYFNYNEQKTINFKRSAGTEYYCFSSATDQETGRPLLLLYPIGDNFTDNATSNIIYPGIYQSTIVTFFVPSNLDPVSLYNQGVRTIEEKQQIIKEEEEEAKKHWYDKLIDSAITLGTIAVVGSLVINLGSKAYAAKKSK